MISRTCDGCGVSLDTPTPDPSKYWIHVSTHGYPNDGVTWGIAWSKSERIQGDFCGWSCIDESRGLKTPRQAFPEGDVGFVEDGGTSNLNSSAVTHANGGLLNGEEIRLI